ncbi:hypothetical protein [Kistimonas asteriae]|uniref:hypothetical protein n=1 Tax=Kistimonas asteriae TaxID=517724 RepID=UPI001BA7842C|nr:hypothetical protein [Kistimonas asteriae]
MDDNRLSRIESKLDQLTEVVVALAKHDERITNLSRRQDRTEERLDTHDKDIAGTLTKVNRNGFVVGLAQFIGASLFGAAVTIGVRLIA